MKRKRSSSFADKAIKSLEESEGSSALKRDTSGASLRRNPSEASTNDGLEDDDEAADQDYTANHYDSGNEDDDGIDDDGNGAFI